MQIDAGRWRNRLLALGGLTAVIALSWLYLVRMNAGMSHGRRRHAAVCHCRTAQDGWNPHQRRLQSEKPPNAGK
jgi:hypothetical protein